MAKWENPAAAISACRRQGRRGAYAVYICALARQPDATSKWTDVARRLAAEGGLSGSTTKKRKRVVRNRQELLGDLYDEARAAAAESNDAKFDRIMAKIRRIEDRKSKK
jgi:hypothetical protein